MELQKEWNLPYVHLILKTKIGDNTLQSFLYWEDGENSPHDQPKICLFPHPQNNQRLIPSPY